MGVLLCGGAAEQWDKVDDGGWSRTVPTWWGGDSANRLNGRVEDFVELQCDTEWLENSRLWHVLVSYVSVNYPMCCSLECRQEDMSGLVEGHQYGIIAVRNVNTESGKQ